MKHILTIIFICCLGQSLQSQSLSEKYIDAWKDFYPSRALSNGMHDAIHSYENPSPRNIKEWVSFNQKMLNKVSGESINGRLLKVQIKEELHKWTKEQPHLNSLAFYSSLITSALRGVSNADFLTEQERASLYCQRLVSIRQISDYGRTKLKRVKSGEARSANARLGNLVDYLSTDFKALTQGLQSNCDYDQLIKEAIWAIKGLMTRAKKKLMPYAVSSSSILGPAEYARKLSLYTDSNLSPEGLSEIALAEIDTVRALMASVSREYLSKAYPDRPHPSSLEALTKAALADMEKDAPLNAKDYLEFWQKLAADAIQFIEANDIATLPKNNTLEIKTAPESAGAAARIGWVSSAPPFDPNPVTTLFLPSIPETLPKQEQIDFWASFNKPFNRMIVIHELLPGHYMQMKISRETSHPVRLLFPFGIYTEGWATFTERVLLDAGWQKGNHLTMLAHLRKRLENANRAYTSVQVHTQGWTQEQVMQFSTEKSLLAPQFAKSLWGRIMRSPMQLTSYFLGGAQFSELLQHEQERLGSKFNLKFFMDTIMKSGPIPIDEFYGIFEASTKK
ncbi:DUF885 family protein [Roseivirga sp. E12]|uniref:DUF885 family protein n=1 Tax=Roseivirga sp. E12 TaxID=2819237 RepID=UPI001ABD313B|nr:DUF885 family protein [Roseivirga sp. E12]MBO3697929.1 DUF885 family protein [Roseivirga sp. E12]